MSNAEYIYNGNIINVVDGDTLDIDVDLGFYIKTQQRFRLIAESDPTFDAPETWRPKTKSEKIHGLEAKQFILNLIKDDTSCTIHSIKKGKYRFVCYVKLNGVDLGDLLIDNGYYKLNNYKDE